MVNWPIMWTELPATKGLKLLKTLKSDHWTSSSCASAQKPMTFKGCKFNGIFTHAWKGLWWQTRLDLGIGQFSTFQNSCNSFNLKYSQQFIWHYLPSNFLIYADWSTSLSPRYWNVVQILVLVNSLAFCFSLNVAKYF